jgi:cytochrome c peroxidase
VEKVELGRYLFYDTQLSLEDNRSCGVCHEQAKGFADGMARAVGTTNQLHNLNSPGLTNIGYFEALTWADPSAELLEDQALRPLLGELPIIEMGMGGMEELLLERLRDRDEYQELFSAAFPADPDPISVSNIALALACFQRTITSWNSPYDRHERGDDSALTGEQLAGMELFFGEAGCSRCHGGPQFNSPTDEDGQVVSAHAYVNAGLYDIDGDGSYPAGHEGLANATGLPEDMGRFKTPSLRNLIYTGPYMHDGSIETLDHAVRVMAEGGRDVTSGPNIGDGRTNPWKDALLVDQQLDDEQLSQLLGFLHGLSDEDFVTDERIASPYPPFVPEPPPGL